MSVIVTDCGFAADDWSAPFTELNELGESGQQVVAVDVPNDAEAADLQGHLGQIDMIRVDFPKSADGRGFTIGRRLRAMGFQGRLRAKGHVLADQYAMARRAGFDEVEISQALAARQPEDQWQFRADWQAHDYQARLRGASYH